MSSTRASKKGAAQPQGSRGDHIVKIGKIGKQQTSQFLQSLRETAPWDVWAEKLALRKRPEPINKLASAPLDWSLPADCAPATSELVKWLSSLSRRRRSGEVPSDWSSLAVDWLDSLKSRPITVALAVELLAWAHALPRLSTRLTAELWAQIFATLVNESVDALELARELLEQDEGPPNRGAADQLVLLQLTAGELPLTMGYQFPKIELCEALAEHGCTTLNDGMLRAMDGEGMPHAFAVPNWYQLLACWTRCSILERRSSSARFSPDAKLQLDWFLRQTLRWRTGDGTFPLSENAPGSRVLDRLVATATEVVGDRVDKELYAVSRGSLKSDDSEYALPPPGEHSEWSQIAVLRSSWIAKKSTHLGLSFHDGACVGQLSYGQTNVWGGEIMPVIRVEGKALPFIGEWEEVCWSSDDDIDYIELEIELKGGWKLQRQLMVARADGFAFMADALIGSRSAPIDYRLEFPICANQIQFVPQDETTEIQLTSADKPLGWAIPLGLSEWKLDSRGGTFDGRLLRQTGTGTALYVPVLWDFDPKRRQKLHTWRHLTVAQDLNILPHDGAVAYRMQAGNKQWIVYRSLGPVGNRTFLGHNLISEFLVARFLKNGEVENLIEIE